MNKRTAAKRKLLPEKLLATCYELREVGVPITRIMREYQLDINRSSLTKLLTHYSIVKAYVPGTKVIVIKRSLFPPWLDNNIQQAQTNPDGWYYVGYFPKGQWHYDN